MPHPAIEVDRLSKQYRIQAARSTGRQTLPTLRETIAGALRGPFRGGAPVAWEEFWALRDVSFGVQPGEVVGIIGRNGAGKSTLLKILARITEPTAGEARLRGRVGSLLEVGAGFHPELTGRENIYLSGSILGLKHRDIKQKLDQIVEFADVGPFLDTPVKRYSSGMHVRLAFAVAAHLEPDILLVDEVLAVGDVAFQRKSQGRMSDVARQGKTVFFVSHNLGLVSDLCARCLLLENGRLVDDGDPRGVIGHYLAERGSAGRVELRDWSFDRRGEGPMRLVWLQAENEAGEVTSKFSYREPLTVRFGVATDASRECLVSVSIRDAAGHVLLHPNNSDDRAEIRLAPPGGEIKLTVAEQLLNSGSYYVTVWLGDGLNVLHDRVGNCLTLEIGDPADGAFRCRGAFRVPGTWRVGPLAEPQ